MRYIDANAAEARVVRDAQGYPYASAHHYARRRGPLWLCRSWVESVVCELEHLSVYDPAAYNRAFASRDAAAIASLVRQRLNYQGPETDPLDDLVGGAPVRVRRWMVYKASLADQTKPGIPLVDAGTLLDAVQEAETDQGPWTVRWGRKERSGWKICAAVLLRDLCGLTYSEIARRMGSDLAFWRRTYEQHAAAIETDREYAERVQLLTQNSLDRLHGS